MYIKVHKKNDQWFRVDTGALVGVAVPPGNMLETLKHIYGNDKLFAEGENKNIIIIYYGYYDEKNIFNHFCKNKTNCSKCNIRSKERFCYKTSYKRSSAGHYIKE